MPIVYAIPRAEQHLRRSNDLKMRSFFSNYDKILTLASSRHRYETSSANARVTLALNPFWLMPMDSANIETVSGDNCTYFFSSLAFDALILK